MNLCSSIPIDSDSDIRKDWISKVRKLYLSWNYYIIRTDSVYFILKRNEELTIDTSNMHTIDKMGYICHPAVKMWLGYEDALKDYINIHIDEHIRRGGENNMIKYNVNKTLSSNRPKWTLLPETHRNHRAKIFDQEYNRIIRNNIIRNGGIPPPKKGSKKNAKPKITKEHYQWYFQFTEFVNAGPFIGYTWY
jgi:hypothetical protein